MNRGLIVGNIYRPNGKHANGAIVFLSRLYGASGLLEIQKLQARVDGRGRYTLPFLWSGAVHADDLMFVLANIGAWTEANSRIGSTMRSQVTAHAKTEVRCVLMQDAIGQLGMITNTFGSIPEIADSAVSLATALNNWSGLVPFWKLNTFSTEGDLLVGAGDIYLQ